MNQDVHASKNKVASSESYFIMVLIIVTLGMLYLSLFHPQIPLFSQYYFDPNVYVFVLIFLFIAIPLSLVVVSHLVSYIKIRSMKPLSSLECSDFAGVLSEACESLNIKVSPRLRITDSENPDCFIYRSIGKQAVIVVTTGILDLLDRDELMAVFIHELSHLKSKDITFMIFGLTSAKIFIYPLFLAGLFIYISLIQNLVLKTDVIRTFSGYISLIYPLVAYFLLSFVFPLLIIRYIYKQRELIADAITYTTLQNKAVLISSIKKISHKLIVFSILEKKIFNVQESICKRFIKKLLTINRFFQPHPELSARFQAVNTEKLVRHKGKTFIPSLRTASVIGIGTLYLFLVMLVLFQFFAVPIPTFLNTRAHKPPSSIYSIIYFSGAPFYIENIVDSSYDLVMCLVFSSAVFISFGYYSIFRNSDISTIRSRDYIKLLTKIFLSSLLYSALIFFMKWDYVFGAATYLPSWGMAHEFLLTWVARVLIYLSPFSTIGMSLFLTCFLSFFLTLVSFFLVLAFILIEKGLKTFKYRQRSFRSSLRIRLRESKKGNWFTIYFLGSLICFGFLASNFWPEQIPKYPRLIGTGGGIVYPGVEYFFESSDSYSSLNFIDPLGDSDFDLTARVGWIRIIARLATLSSHEDGVLNAPRLMQSEVEGSFSAETMIEATFNNGDEAGIIVWLNSEKYVTLIRTCTESTHQIVLKASRGSRPLVVPLSESHGQIYLELVYSGDKVKGYYSYDREHWQVVSDFALIKDYIEFEIENNVDVGLYVSTKNQFGVFSADFDDFKIH